MSVAPVTRPRSLLFMPGRRPDMIAKIPRFAPDLAVADLEDAVAVADKDEARGLAAAAIGELAAGPTVVLVRVNPIGTQWFADDLAAAAGSGAAGVVVPKLETVTQLQEIHDALAALSWPDAVLLVGIETGLGVADARPLLAGGVSAAYFGAEDYIADIGGRRTASSTEVLYARSQVCLAAHLSGVPAIDQAVVGLDDPEAFLVDARAGADMGYQGKICIHPAQVELAHRVHTPTPDEVARARAVVEAGATGVGVLDGEMIDDVHVRIARRILDRAGVSE